MPTQEEFDREFLIVLSDYTTIDIVNNKAFISKNNETIILIGSQHINDNQEDMDFVVFSTISHP